MQLCHCMWAASSCLLCRRKKLLLWHFHLRVFNGKYVAVPAHSTSTALSDFFARRSWQSLDISHVQVVAKGRCPCVEAVNPVAQQAHEQGSFACENGYAL